MAKTYLTCGLALLLLVSPAAAQVIVQPSPEVEVKIEEAKPSAMRLFSPVPRQVFTGDSLKVVGIALNPTYRGMVRIRLGDVEQLVSVDEKGRFSTVMPLKRWGVNTLIVDAGGVPHVVEVIYRPPQAMFVITAPNKGSLYPGDSLQLMPAIQFGNGELQRIDSGVVWRLSNKAVGRVEAGSRFVAVGPGRTVVQAVYGDTTAAIPIQVIPSEPPAPSAGLSNVTVTSPKVRLAIWDDSIPDGDKITIFLNGRPIVEHLEIFREAKVITLTLNPGHNTVEILAENEGWTAPNTAALAVIPENGQGIEQHYQAHQNTKRKFVITLK
jgi:hypothetical protein